MHNFLFYDLETSGLNPAFDQILQFAAVLTDEELTTKQEFFIEFKLRSDIIPSAHALLTNNIDISHITKNGKCEFEGIKEIFHIINTPNTINAGFNSLRFDDEFLRFSFHRNLVPPYTHQYKNGCFRADIIAFLPFYFLFENDFIKWPKRNNKISFALEGINDENKLLDGVSHHALVDAQITCELAKLLYQRQKSWNFILECFDKQAEISKIKKLPSFENNFYYGLLLSYNFSYENNYIAPCLYLGDSKKYAKQGIWLRLDLKDTISKINVNNIDNTDDITDDKPYLNPIIRKKYGEPPFLLIPDKDKYENFISADRRKIINDNIKWIRNNKDTLLMIQDYHVNFKYPYIPNLDIDAALYQEGFLSKEEENFTNKFHNANIDEKIKLSESAPSSKTKTIAQRILLRNYFDETFETIKDSSNLDFLDIKNEPLDFRKQKKLNLKSALDEIKDLEKDASFADDKKKIILNLKEYLENKV